MRALVGQPNDLSTLVAGELDPNHAITLTLSDPVGGSRNLGDTTEDRPLPLAALPIPLRWEIAYGISTARTHPNPPHLSYSILRSLINGLQASAITSLLDHDESDWPRRGRRLPNPGDPDHKPAKLNIGFLTFTIDQLDVLAGCASFEHEYRHDRWRLRRLGVDGIAAGWILDFTNIDQPWLRDAAKRFVRWRHDTGLSASCLSRDVISLSRLSRALTATHGPAAAPHQLTRPVIDRLLTLLREDGLTPNGRRIALSSVARFFTIARQHDWIPGVPTNTGIYSDDIPATTALLPRGLSEYVMAQLEAPRNLDKLTDPRWRLLFPLLMQTGLRSNDALHLGQDCLVRDGDGAPYLRYLNRKMKREALVPISEEMAGQIGTQIAHVRETYSPAAALFPRIQNNADGTAIPGPNVFNTALKTWVLACDIRDEHQIPIHLTAHQFRHTLGTRLINNDVPQEVVRKILDHTSTEMTAHYARLHDSTVRRHWEQARKVNIHGDPVTVAEDSPLADAAWTKQHLSRATMALPNGYCGLPLQQSCPHANACLSCPVFITTPEFLPQHRDHLQLTLHIVERAEQNGQTRLAEMNTRTADNLTAIIASLERDESKHAAGQPE